MAQSRLVDLCFLVFILAVFFPCGKSQFHCITAAVLHSVLTLRFIEFRLNLEFHLRATRIGLLGCPDQVKRLAIDRT